MIFKKVENNEDSRKERFVRETVFICEQQCPVEIEFDEYDSVAFHYILTDENGAVIGCCRILTNEIGVKIGRIAILKEYRGNNYGYEIVSNAINEAKKVCEEAGKPFPETKIYVDAQVYANGFYRKLGFLETGDEFIEANIPHNRMFLKSDR